MAIEHVVSGPVIVTFDAVPLGYSRDGVRVEIAPRWLDVHSDDFGGEAGAPSDSQLMGAMATITAELTKFDAALVAALTSFEESGTAGTLPTLGSFVRQSQLAATLLLNGSIQDWTFATAFLRRPMDFNAGMRYQTWTMGWEAWIDAAATRVLLALA